MEAATALTRTKSKVILPDLIALLALNRQLKQRKAIVYALSLCMTIVPDVLFSGCFKTDTSRHRLEPKLLKD